MTPATEKLLSDNFAELAASPQGIKQLRQLILQLAVQGKIVPQNPDDEPASVLLEKIAKEKAKLIKAGKIKKQKPLPEIEENEVFFDMPHSWKLCRLRDLLEIINGRAYKKKELLDSGTPVLRVGNLFTSKAWYYSDLSLVLLSNIIKVL